MKAIGLMSGTSADGIDAALVEIKGKGLGCKVNLLSFKKFPFPEGLQELIHKASTPEYGRVDLICHLNFLMGELFAGAAIGVVKKTGYKMEDIDIIGSHGQTIYHIPTGVKSSEFGVWSSELNRKSQIASTLQIGEPSIIAERTGVMTIADFRTRDMAAGGLGAPLTPFAHYMLFKDGDIGKAVNNIGGISNLTFIPAGGGLDDLVAFDTGPGNMLIDSIVNIITKGEMSYDNNGKIALKGKICERLLEKLMVHPFIKKKPPKSTGREEFGYNEALKIFRTAKRYRLSDEDIVATVTGFTAKSIAESYHRFILNKHHLSEIILCGGGAKNPAIIKMIKNYMKPIKVNTSDRYGFPPEAIEAIAFAILGYAAVIGIPSNLPQVTGAGKKVVMGKIIKGKNQ
jgi:anhydro-N-acetylmuramic acid kinase